MELSRKDDGTSEWAAEEAVGLIGIAYIRASKESEQSAIDLLDRLSSFILDTKYQRR